MPGSISSHSIRQMDMRIADLILSYQGGHGHLASFFVPNNRNTDSLLGAIEGMRLEIKTQDFPDFWVSHFDAVLRGFRYVVLEHTHLPHNYVYPLSGFVEARMRNFDSDPESQTRILLDKLANLEAVLTGVTEKLVELPDRRRKQAITACGNVINVLLSASTTISESSRLAGSKSQAALLDSLDKSTAQLTKAMAKIEGMEPYTGAYSPIPFEVIMQDGMQVPMGEVMSWHLDDYHMRWEEFRQAGRRIDPNRDPFDIIRQDAKNYSSHEEQVADANEIVKAIRAAALRYVSLPEGEVCHMGAVPEQSKLFCPTAVYIGGNVWRKEMWGMMGFNADNFEALNRAELWGHITHECYPGHHTNYVKTAAASLPHTFMMRLPLTRTVLEGVAHRSETLMMPYYEDDIARLASHRRVLYCATRVKVEVDLNLLGKTADEVVEMYQSEMRINDLSARLQTQAHVMNPGDAVSYYTGAKILEAKRVTMGMDDARFTEKIFSFGFLPVNTMLEILDLDDQDQAALINFHS